MGGLIAKRDAERALALARLPSPLSPPTSLDELPMPPSVNGKRDIKPLRKSNGARSASMLPPIQGDNESGMTDMELRESLSNESELEGRR